jgi:hypothetical protein
MNLDNKKSEDKIKNIHLKRIKIFTDILDKFISVNY